MNTYLGFYVVTFDTWHLAISFDLVQGNMLVSQGRVLSPGNEGFLAVNVYVHLFPQLCFICVHMPISGPSFLFGAILVHARHRETTGVLNGSPQCGLDYCCICGI